MEAPVCSKRRRRRRSSKEGPGLHTETCQEAAAGEHSSSFCLDSLFWGVLSTVLIFLMALLVATMCLDGTELGASLEHSSTPPYSALLWLRRLRRMAQMPLYMPHVSPQMQQPRHRKTPAIRRFTTALLDHETLGQLGEGGDSAGDLPRRPGESGGAQRTRLTVDDVDWSKIVVQDVSKPETEAEVAGSRETKSFFAGIVRDLSTIEGNPLQDIFHYNCEHSFGVHFVTKENPSVFRTYHRTYVNRHYGDDAEQAVCGPFLVLQEPDNLVRLMPNRVDRIAFLRDLQRSHLRAAFGVQQHEAWEDRVVILADFDLYQFPPLDVTIEQVRRVATIPDYHDVVCAAGEMHHPPGYYDIFATVFLPNSFAYPISGRILDNYTAEEDTDLVRSNDIYGHVTQANLMDYIIHQAEQSETGCTPVRSCFGGFTIYRASTFFTPSCRYILDTEKYLMQFANKEDGRPCEHVVFHDCLLREEPGVTIAVHPSLVSSWDAPFIPAKRILPGKINEGLIGEGTDHKGLVAVANRTDRGNILRNGDFQLRIDEVGSLVVERRKGRKKLEIVWEAEVYTYYYDPDWTFMFLILSRDGLLMLVQQTDISAKTNNTDFCDVRIDLERACRTVIWTSERRSQAAQRHKFYLTLRHDGRVEVRNGLTHAVFWANDEDEAGVELANPLVEVAKRTAPTTKEKGGCLDGGTEDDIKTLLRGTGLVVVLCQKAVFTLSTPIKFFADHQQVFTEGDPDDDRRAVLRICSTHSTTAVNMAFASNVELRSVIIDGCSSQMASNDDKALIVMGGSGVSSQRLRQVHAFGARGCCVVQLHQGNATHRCSRPLLEDNVLGPAGISKRPVAGMVVACRDSRIRHNHLQDISGSAIAIVGAPGSVIEYNHIESRENSMTVGISMVKYLPYDGDYSNTIVRRNRIEASNSSMKTAVAMGMWMSQCMSDVNSTMRTKALFGAMVTENVLAGDHMGYGFLVDGVDTWLVTKNYDETTGHIGRAGKSKCQQEPLTQPAGFLIHRQRATGAFQREFQNATIERAMLSWSAKDKDSGEKKRKTGGNLEMEKFGGDLEMEKLGAALEMEKFRMHSGE